MIDVTYTQIPTRHTLKFVGVSSRILTENLLRNPNINVHFSNACLVTDMIDLSENQLKFDFSPALNKILGLNILVFALDYMPSKRYQNMFLSSIDTEYVMVTAFHLFELIAVSHLLNDNRKVVLGGVLTNLFSKKYLRKILKLMNTKNLHNLIIVSGYVDLTTDLYSVIRNWKDFHIEKNDFKTVWDCNHDYIQDLRRKKNLFVPANKNLKWWDNYEYISFALNMKCLWGKCKFCSYKRLPVCDFRDDPDRIVNSIRKSMKKYKSSVIRFIDSYFEFDDFQIKILERLRRDYNIEAIFLGVKSLSDENFVKKVNGYLHYFLTGLESFSNRQLRIINKGFSTKEIWKMADNLDKYVEREKPINLFMVMDLPSKYVHEVEENYKKAIEFKQKMYKNGFKNVRFTFQLLSLNKANELREGFVFDESIPSGQHRIISEMKKAEFFNKYDGKLINEIHIPFHRNLPSDIDIIKPEVMDYLTKWEEC